MKGATDVCRIDVWLWRARFVKTRGLAARLVEAGAVRLIRQGQTTRLDKPSREVRPGDDLTFMVAGRLVSLRVLACGDRRGPAEEARALYEVVEPTV
ncbi:RNA-binding S4 domain-containing protein [Brevundimonas sp. VNH65]|uniref:RNA-binding S4 domain-containing protein n=1 Tax=Brevundimonas sp. VNH65 TaxID=3400917 RepID=UPI003BFD9EBB